jgi:hypothetical protein
MTERGSKTVVSRVKESVELIRKFNELGVVDTEPGLVQMRTQMNDWIRGGPAWQGRIEFPRYGRYADVVLPDREGKAATVDFKMHK